MGTALAVRRRSMAGQTPIIWVGYLILVVCWAGANTLWFGDAFRSTQWVLLDLCCLLGGLGLLYASIRWPAPVSEQREPAAQLV
jgi:hypothetical protein